MTYDFYYLSHIILAYLDDITNRSKKKSQHLEDLRLIFKWRCRYNIRLNPLKFIFLITVGCPLGFIISQHGIKVDPLKFQETSEILPPKQLLQLKIFKGKDNFQ